MNTLDLSQSFINFDQNHNELPIFSSCLNVESRMKYFAAWRPILRNMLLMHRKQNRVTKVQVFKSLLVDHLEMTELILDIFGCYREGPKGVENEDYDDLIKKIKG